MSIRVRFGAMELEGIVNIQTRRANKVAAVSIPRRHGALVPTVAFSEALYVSMAGEIWRDTPEAVRDYFDDLGAKLSNVGNDRLELIDDDRYVLALCVGTAFPQIDANRAPAQRAGFQIEFIAGDPFWYASGESQNEQIAIASSPHQWVITNNGKIRTPVAVEVTAVGAPKTDVKVTNSTTGLFMRFTGTIAADSSVIFDSRRNRASVQNGGSNALNNFEGQFWALEIGDNNITYVGPTGVNVKTIWSARFIH